MILTIKRHGCREMQCTLQEAVSQAAEGADYDRGKLEAIEKSLQYTQDMLAKLLAHHPTQVIKQVLAVTNKLEVLNVEDGDDDEDEGAEITL